MKKLMLNTLASLAILLAPISSFASAPAEQNNGSSEVTGSNAYQPPLPPVDDQVIHDNGDVTIRLTPTNIKTFLLPTLDNLVRSYTKLTGVDMEDDKVIDDFAAIVYCDLYTKYFPNEFVWRQAREAIRQKVQRDLEKYPEYFLVSGSLSLGRYDFEKHSFGLAEDSKMDHTGRFDVAVKMEKPCSKAAISVMPLTFNIRLTNPITLDSIPVAESLAHDVTEAVKPDKDSLRQVFVSFYFRANDFSTRNTSSSNDNLTGAPKATMRATLLSMRVYQDKEHTKLIYDYRPH